MPQRYRLLFCSIAFIVIIPIIFFYNIDSAPLRDFDESVNIMNAYNAMQNNSSSVSELFLNKSISFFSKIEILSFKTFDISVVSARIPSAIAGLLTCLILFLFISIQFKRPLWGLTTAITLCSINSYIDFHSTRTADPDAIFTLLTTAIIISIYLLLFLSKTNKTRVIATTITTVLCACAYLLKREQLGLILISLAFAIICNLNFKHKQRILTSAFVIFILIASIMIMNNSLKIEDSYYYYTYYFATHEDSMLLLFAMLSFPLIFSLKNSQISKFLQITAITGLVYTLFISVYNVKVQWYLVPALPLLAIQIAYGLLFAMKSLILLFSKYLNKHFFLKTNLIIISAVAYLLFPSYNSNLNKIKNHSESDDHYAEFFSVGKYLQSVIDKNKNVNNYKILFEGPADQVKFYLEILKTKGQSVSIVNQNQIAEGDIVIANQDWNKDFIENNFDVKSLTEYNDKHLKIYKIIKHK